MSMTTDANNLPTELHALAQRALECVKAIEPLTLSHIPASVFAELRDQLSARLSETEIFMHFCLLWKRLKDQGADRAAEQMLMLAKIGLDPLEAELAQKASRTPPEWRPVRGLARGRGGVSLGPKKPRGA
jgi:hypothetical protein